MVGVGGIRGLGQEAVMLWFEVARGEGGFEFRNLIDFVIGVGWCYLSLRFMFTPRYRP